MNKPSTTKVITRLLRQGMQEFFDEAVYEAEEERRRDRDRDYEDLEGLNGLFEEDS